jgi:phage/plasmid-like protein (TIGR03299 family)
MAHELHFEDGEAAMMYVGQVPWHGLGTRLETAPKTAEEAMKAARLDWEIGLKRVYAMDGEHFHEVRDRKAVVRLDKWSGEKCEPFGLVGNDYHVLQNREAFSFFDPIVETGKVHYNTAGALGRGERIWVLAKVSEPMSIKGDEVEKYLLLSNGHDGRTALQIRFTPIRVVCQNTLSAALASRGDLFKSYHNAQMHRKIEDAQEIVKSILGYYDELGKRFTSFASKQMTEELIRKYVEVVFPEPKRKRGESDRRFEFAMQRNNEHRSKSVRLFENGRGNSQPNVKGTLWAAYNGVTELVDHHWGLRKSRAETFLAVVRGRRTDQTSRLRRSDKNDEQLRRVRAGVLSALQNPG